MIPPSPTTTTLHYATRESWAWVAAAALRHRRVAPVGGPRELPSFRGVPPLRPSTRPSPALIRLEIVDDDEKATVRRAVHGTGFAFRRLADKDDLVRALARRGRERFAPTPSALVPWDAVDDDGEWRDGEREKVVEAFPFLDENEHDESRSFAVLKAPLGSRGEGIHFVSRVDEVRDVVRTHRERALAEGGDFLDGLRRTKGRIPDWVLQREVRSLVVAGGRKFHARSHVLVEADGEVLVYGRHEVRVAKSPVVNDDDARPRDAHVTNGACAADGTERRLLDEMPELVDAGVRDLLEDFLARLFHGLREELASGASDETPFDVGGGVSVSRFAVAGVDVMIEERPGSRLLEPVLLEVNAHAAAPPEEVLSLAFRDHMVGFVSDLVRTVLREDEVEDDDSRGKHGSRNNFVSVNEILLRGTRADEA